MAGIYLHIPFCRKACHYCNFHFSTSLRLKNDFISALLKEIKLRYDYIGTETIDTIYFGGGTPSLLGAGETALILDGLRQHYQLADNAEITLEANPDDINMTKLEEWQAAGINRLSIGIQSFFDEDLVWMNRAHHAGQALKALGDTRKAGFSNISIDLIYGTPNLTDSRWLKNVEIAIGHQVPHLSCYALTVEPATALHKMIEHRQYPALVPDDQARQFLLLTDRLQSAGYEHYEISNFALPGYRSRHNSSYWQGKNYLGLGPSAHSFNGHSRQWNLANNALYIGALHDNQLKAETETLTRNQQLNEYLMISLRTKEGIDTSRLEQEFGEAEAARIMNDSGKYVKSGKMEKDGHFLRLTREGKLFADGIAGELFRI